VATDPLGANAGMIRTEIGAILIDAPFIPKQARAWRAQSEQFSPNGVAYMINTDYHLSHILGTCFLLPATTIAHELTWKQLRALDRDATIERALEHGQGRISDLAGQLGDVRIVLPQITVGKAMTLWCDTERVDILHLGGHTPATLGVYLPEQRVLFSGDLIVNGRHPYAGDAVCLQWLEALESVRMMDVETIVPGHGSPAGPEIIGPLHDYLSELYCRVKDCYHAGHTRRETVERVKPLDAFPVARGDEEHLRRLLRSSVERVYDEIKKAHTRGRQRVS
jgi:cyclase